MSDLFQPLIRSASNALIGQDLSVRSKAVDTLSSQYLSDTRFSDFFPSYCHIMTSPAVLFSLFKTASDEVTRPSCFSIGNQLKDNFVSAHQAILYAHIISNMEFVDLRSYSLSLEDVQSCTNLLSGECIAATTEVDQSIAPSNSKIKLAMIIPISYPSVTENVSCVVNASHSSYFAVNLSRISCELNLEGINSSLKTDGITSVGIQQELSFPTTDTNQPLGIIQWILEEILSAGSDGITATILQSQLQSYLIRAPELLARSLSVNVSEALQTGINYLMETAKIFVVKGNRSPIESQFVDDRYKSSSFNAQPHPATLFDTQHAEGGKGVCHEDISIATLKEVERRCPWITSRSKRNIPFYTLLRAKVVSFLTQYPGSDLQLVHTVFPQLSINQTSVLLDTMELADILFQRKPTSSAVMLNPFQNKDFWTGNQKDFQ